MKKNNVAVSVQRGIKFEPVVYEGFGVDRLIVKANKGDVAKAMEAKFGYEVQQHSEKVEALANAYIHMPVAIVCNVIWLQFVAGIYAFDARCKAEIKTKPPRPNCSQLETLFREYENDTVGVWGTKVYVSATVPKDGWKGFDLYQIQKAFFGLPIYTSECTEARRREEKMLWSGVAEVEVDYEGAPVEDGFYEVEDEAFSDEGYHVEDDEYIGDAAEYALDAAQDAALEAAIRTKRLQAAHAAMMDVLANDETVVDTPMAVAGLDDVQVEARFGLRLAKEKGKLVNPAALWSNTRKNLRK